MNEYFHGLYSKGYNFLVTFFISDDSFFAFVCCDFNTLSRSVEIKSILAGGLAASGECLTNAGLETSFDIIANHLSKA